jgi:hypothetical protein
VQTLILIGNCQVEGLKRHFEAMLPRARITAYEVWKMTPADIEAAGRALEHADVVVTQPLHAPQYGPLQLDALKAPGRPFRLMLIHNLHFEGAMPDCAYVGRLGHRIASPVSNYHSRIVLQAFLDGVDEAAAHARMLDGHGVDARRVWAKQVDELRRRESLGLVPFVDEVEALSKERRSFHMINHPAGHLLGAYAHKVASLLLGSTPELPEGVPDLLEAGGAWPTLPYVRAANGLAYERSHFVLPGQEGRPMTTEEFVERSYGIYRGQAATDLVL